MYTTLLLANLISFSLPSGFYSIKFVFCGVTNHTKWKMTFKKFAFTNNHQHEPSCLVLSQLDGPTNVTMDEWTDGRTDEHSYILFRGSSLITEKSQCQSKHIPQSAIMPHFCTRVHHFRPQRRLKTEYLFTITTILFLP